MKQASQFLPGLVLGVYFLFLVILYSKLSFTALFTSLGLGAIVYSGTESMLYAAGAAIVGLFVMTTFVPASLLKGSEGFNTNTPPADVSKLVTSMKKEKSATRSGPDSVTDTIMRNGYSLPGFGLSGPFVEGFEDAKKDEPAPASKEDEKNEKPAPVKQISKDALPQPFTLGEIPAQVKNGPHIDAGSTLIKAIQSLNPDQINAMTKDTQQLIETQKSLMGMLGTMKPMLNDGKQLMDTFQQMFGQ
uniref:Uncharacterized protein n=1 Tax=viral metagenome TaxID=1070528 RepID=A0A6C0KCD5_9ZZZZ